MKAMPAGITCPHYEPLAGGKRCASYCEGGGCARPDEFMCSEWLKLNGRAVPTRADTHVHAAGLSEKTPSPAAGIQARPHAGSEATPAGGGTVVVRDLTEEEIASFRALGVEVCIETVEAGDVWLVPEYTERARQELRVDHAATLAALCSAFPGSRVTAFSEPAADAVGAPLAQGES